ncbi:MAG: HD domain-containing protein [Candidatus Brockarchaeota archaeon]|nr:HD domain-containing protein [Candidatus Brockarchaeota archaeon]
MNILDAINAVKCLRRTGWMQLGMPDAETVASHSFEAAVLALELASAVGANPEKAAVLALTHDLPEAVMGDILKWASSRMTRIDIEAAMEIESEDIPKLVSEFSEEKTREAKVARMCDLLSTNIQARRYLRIGYDATRIEEETRKQIFSMLENVELKPLRKKVECLMDF